MKNKEIDTLEKINILIIEEKLPSTKLVKKILPGKQFKIDVVKNHNEAVKKLSEGEYEIVITESKFSGVKDIELIKRIKDIKSELCLIVASGFSSIKEALDSLKAGAYDYIPVPFDEEAAKIILNKAIERQQLYKERDKYKELSNLDSLTDLYNHRHFHELLEKEVTRSKRYSRITSLLMIDIDNFKQFNDTYGHLEGDRILKKISKFFLQNVRNIDYVCRYGGEEFTIILPETDKEGAFILARRLRLLTPTSIYKTKHTTKIKPAISIGLSCYPTDAQDKNELIKKADLALYEAKFLGKNRICIFTPELEKTTKRINE